MTPRRVAMLPILLMLLGSSVVLAQETRRQYLSGKGIDDAVPWEFFCSAGNQSGQWATIPVPSCWEMHGFGTIGYGRRPKAQQHLPVPSEQGKYRHRFQVPADWSGQTIFLVFDGSMTDTQASVNGQSAGPVHQGAFYRFRYDVTKLIKPGGENLLEVTVDKQSANESVNNAEREGDYWNFGGIFRPVYLEARPAQHVDRVAIDARADGTFAMDVFTAGVTTADTIRAQILDLNGQPAGDAVTKTIADGKAKIQTKIASPRQWTAETPNLYQVEVTLAQGETPLHRTRQRFGFRTIEVRAGQGIFVNGQRILLKGTNRHTFWPESGRATSEKLSRGDIQLMKEMNNNAVRMSHYPPDEHFLDLCDELGLYVLDELAGWHQSYDEPTARRLVEQMVTRDVNHPSILFWDNANEGGWNTAVDDDFAKWDPQNRRVLHPWTLFRGIDTKHYPQYHLLLEKARGTDIYFPTEFQHALFDGGGGVALADYWEVLRTSRISGGGFIWAFCDETLKRPDQGGKMDGAGNQAPDGIVGPYREKEASFYAVKEIWSPVVVRRSGDGGEFTVENRYDFTNTSECAFIAQLRKFRTPTDNEAGFTVLKEERLASPSIAPHATGTLKLHLPTDSPHADAIALRVNDPKGNELWTWVWPLKQTSASLNAKAAGKIAATEDDQSIIVTAGDFSATFSKATAQLTAVRRGNQKFSLLNGPRLAVGDAKLRQVEHRAVRDDYAITATFDGNLRRVEWLVRPDGELRLNYACRFDGDFDYFGVSFDLPEADVKRMRWLGHGPFRVWKNRHEGGTLNVWENALNNTQTGYSDWVYPEFKGYYAGVRWMQLHTTAGPITIALDDPSLYVQVLRPQFPGDPKPLSPTTATTEPIPSGSHLSANAWAPFPDAGFSILHGIAPMGDKFHTPNKLGPQSRQNRAAGEYRGAIRFSFGATAEN